MTNNKLPEITIKALFLGVILSMVLAGANAYLGLFAGMTVSASIPAAASGAFGGAAGTNITNNAKFFKDINNDVAGIQGLIGSD